MKKEKTLTIRISERDYERLEKIGDKLEIPKTRLARNLILMALEDAETYNKLGFFEIAKAINKLRKKANKNGIDLQTSTI
jgi:predicted DNA-binding protein